MRGQASRWEATDWPVYKNEAGRWCILESTLDKIYAHMPDADELAGEGQPFRYEPLYRFNDHHLWEIFSRSATKTGAGNLKKYFKARTKKVDMRKVLQGGGEHYLT